LPCVVCLQAWFLAFTTWIVVPTNTRGTTILVEGFSFFFNGFSTIWSLTCNWPPSTRCTYTFLLLLLWLPFINLVFLGFMIQGEGLLHIIFMFVVLADRFWQLCKVLVIHLVILICFFLEAKVMALHSIGPSFVTRS